MVGLERYIVDTWEQQPPLKRLIGIWITAHVSRKLTDNF